MSLENDIKEVTGINRTNRRIRIAYLFKRGDSIRNLARQFDLRSFEVEDCIRGYMKGDEAFEDVEKE